jgi:hypothetical protein
MAKVQLLVNKGTGGGNPEPLPLYKPKDTTLVKLDDKRQINPATGTPYKTKGAKGINANEEDIKAIISHAKAKGVDPYTALAIGLQETNLGQANPNYGSAWSTFEDEGIPDDRGRNANILAKAIKEKMAYAQELRKRGLLPAGEEYDLQTYNGLGLLKPRQTAGAPVAESFYGIPVTGSHPLDLKKNPAYGKIVKQLREEVIRTNPRIKELIESTQAYGAAAPTVPAATPAQKVVLQVRK